MKNKLAWLFIWCSIFGALTTVAMIAFLAESLMEYFRILDSFTGTARLFASAACGGLWGLLLLNGMFRTNEDEK